METIQNLLNEGGQKTTFKNIEPISEKANECDDIKKNVSLKS